MAQGANYATVTNTRRAATNFNVETIRGLALDATTQRLYAINTHGSTLLYYDASSGLQPAAVFRTLNNPTALALLDTERGERQALVVGGGTHGVAFHDRDTGVILDFLKLPSEPMDIVVDAARGRAFVSCGGAYDREIPGVPGQPKRVESGGVVVEIDVLARTEVARHFIPAHRPMFLHLDTTQGPGNHVVHVAAHLSGNRSTFQMVFPGAEAEVVTRDAPEDDLFAIDEIGNVTPFMQDVGTLLTAHGRHPNGDYWVLGVNSRNDEWETESLHRGRFADNEVSILSSGVITPVSLDAGGAKPASFPFGLDFHARLKLALVSGSTGDVVRILDDSGSLVQSVPLPDGAIPRSILVTDTTFWVYGWGRNEVYEFDVNAVVGLGQLTPAATLDLGHDPLPDAVKRGREIWYDADRSLDDRASPPVAGKVTCNTCHPRGGMDLLGWQIEDGVSDRKDLMVTQSLFGIEDTFPYHWRGERSLSDFNETFRALLGTVELQTGPTSELADFEAFVFSLQGCANPRQHLDRVLDDSRTLELLAAPTLSPTVLSSNASAGQTTYLNDTNALLPFPTLRCADCHGIESGTNGIITQDVISVLPTQINSDASHLRQLAHKLLQKATPATVGGTSIGTRPQSGFGLSQDGDNADILEFLITPLFFPWSSFTVPEVLASERQRVDTAAFVAQFDEGIAPRAHHAIYFTTAEADDVRAMIKQADNGDIDLAVTAYIGTFALPMHYDSSTGRFHTMGPAFAGDFSDTFAGLQTAHSMGVGLFFVGLPPGNGFRFSADRDNDGLPGQLELAIGTDPLNDDTDGDGYPDGYERDVQLAHPTSPISPIVANTTSEMFTTDTDLPAMLTATHDHDTGRISKHFVTFSEPVTYTVQIQRKDAAGVYSDYGPPRYHSALRRMDTLVAHGLFPSLGGTTEEYRLRVDMVDMVGRTDSVFVTRDGVNATTGPIQARPTFLLGDVFISSNLDVVPSGSPGGIELHVDIQPLAWNPSGPDTYVAFQILEKNAATGEYSIAPTVTGASGSTTRVDDRIDFYFGGTFQAYWGAASGTGQSDPVVSGPFVLSERFTGGSAIARVTLPTTSIGKEHRVIVLGVLQELPGGPYNPPRIFALDNQRWQMPMSPMDGRRADFTLQ